MKGLMTSSMAMLALLVAPVLAQEATGEATTDPAASEDTAAQAGQDMAAAGDQQILDAAIQSAQGVGIADAQPLEGAFALQGTSPTGTPIIMVVGPAGELLAIATTLMVSPPGGAAGDVTDVEPTSAETGAEAGTEPAAGEPAQEGFMATQTQPASPGMWDPSMVEGAMQGLGGATGETTTGATGEAASP